MQKREIALLALAKHLTQATLRHNGPEYDRRLFFYANQFLDESFLQNELDDAEKLMEKVRRLEPL